MCDDRKDYVRYLQFDIESKRLKEAVVSPVLQVNLGVCLRLFRYGLIHKDTPDEYAYEGENTEGLSPEKAPLVENYKYCRKPLKEGYLYVYNEKGKHQGIWYEYEIVYGRLVMVVWEGEDKDVRQPKSGTKAVDSLIVDRKGCVNIAYSPIQWSAKYTREIMDSEQLRNRRMQKIDIEEWFRCFSLPDTVDIDNASVVLTCSGDDGDITNKNRVMRDIRIDKNAQDKNWSLYVTLHSPLDCAEDICRDIYKNNRELSQLITPSEDFKDTASERFLLQAHAIAFYQLLYGKERDNDKLKNLQDAIVSEDFLKKMLDVEKRGVIKNRINERRKSLLLFIDSDYYRMVMEELGKQTPDNRNRMDEMIINQHLTLQMDPSSMDRHLDVSSPPPPVNKDINAYLNCIKEEDTHPVSEYIFQPIALDEVEDMELVIKNQTGLFSLATIAQRADIISANTQSGVAGTKIDYDYKTTRTVTIPQKWLSKVYIRSKTIGEIKQDLWIVDKMELTEVLDKLGRTRTEAYVGGMGRGKVGEVGIPISKVDNHILEGCIKLNADIDPQKSALTKINNKLEKLFFCKPLLLLSGAIACYNLMGTLNGKKDTRIELFSVGINAIVVTSEITWFSLKYTEIHAGTNKKNKAVGITGDINLVLTIIANLADAFRTYNTRDMDTCTAYIISAASYSAALYFSTGYGLQAMGKLALQTGIKATTLSKGNSVLFIAIGAIICCYIIPVYCQDIPIVAYLKNCILCNKAEKKIKNWKSLYSKSLFDALLERKDDIISSGFIEWKNIKTSYEEFLLLTTISEITPEYDVSYKAYLGYNIEYEKINKITIKSNFSRIYFDTRIEFYLIVFYRRMPNSEIQSRKYEKKDFHSSDFHIEMEKNYILIELKHVFSNLESYIQEADQVKGFICQRLLYADGTTFPYDDKFLTAKVNIKSAAQENSLTPIAKMLEDAKNYDEYCNHQNKTMISMEELKELIYKNGLI